MPSERRNYDEELQHLMSELAESVANASDADLLDEAREEGRDPVAQAERIRSVLNEALKAYRQRRLSEAHAEYERRVAALRQREYRLPATADARRNLLISVLRRQPEFGAAVVTAQYRDFKDLPDSDVDSYLRQLAELGVLADIEPEERPKP
jgi:hypothetical protein